eukprot:TRINITY_DN8049_c0_g1_i1.p1 TRINITY_DN8049_c0_g1~~TRINITY_DN8049_c0_g1_i1.p1  ORF type:complete len:655 (-),score=107.61 TRINITY_DN8049_c0_g1_i1:527-2491(-)
MAPASEVDASAPLRGSRRQPFRDVAEALQRDGFAVARACIDDAEALRKSVDEYERDFLPKKHRFDVRREKDGEAGPDGLQRVVHVQNVHEHPRLAHLAADPRLLRLASACLGGVGVRPILNTELFDKPPNGNMSTQTPPHQDNFYFKAQEPGIALWIALEDMGSDSGTVQYVRGSHRRGTRFHDWDWASSGFAKTILDFSDEDDDLLCDVGDVFAGDVVIHHGLTIHYAPTNVSSKRRRGLVVNYVAESVAYTLNDDVHVPALVFRLLDTGRLVADLPSDWPERRAFAITCVKCALTGWEEIEDGIPHTVSTDADTNKISIEILDPKLLRQAVIALVMSGHLVRGASAVRSLPHHSEKGEPLTHTIARASTRVPDDFVGVWQATHQRKNTGSRVEAEQLAMRLVSRSGAFVEIRMPRSVVKLKAVDPDCCHDVQVLAEQRASAGRISVQGDCRDTVVRVHVADFQPFIGVPDTSRVHWDGKGNAVLHETALGSERTSCEETWTRMDESLGHHCCAALELIDDAQGRHGFWIVVGSWFGRVISRKPNDQLSDLVGRSLSHIMKTYAEDLEIESGDAAFGCEASFGRVESAGVLRVLYDVNPSRETTLLLNDASQQLRRDAGDCNVLVESWSSRRWRICDMTSACAAFGTLKRAMC